MTQIRLHKLHTMLNKKPFLSAKSELYELYWKEVQKYIPDLRMQTLVCISIYQFSELPMTFLKI